ncbi:hypothetical protein DFH06DRAFT_1416850 [Mycena polygramma]|nr:hypothetical protein DFH06DRAFT_1416850 [Mycena polygramma]
MKRPTASIIFIRKARRWSKHYSATNEESPSGSGSASQWLLRISSARVPPLDAHGALTMDPTIDPTIFEAGWDLALSVTTVLGVATFLYGILLILLGMAAFLLYHWTGPSRKTLAMVTLALAILSTAQITLQISGNALQLRLVRLALEGEALPLKTVTSFRNIFVAKDFLFVTNNIVTDSLFIYRCFIVRGRNARVAALPLLLLLATSVLGYLFASGNIFGFAPAYHIAYHIDTRVPIAMGLATNMVLMGLTAGRIWWIRREACVLQSAHVKKYNTTIAIILESGAIYCISNLLYLIPGSTLQVNSSSSLLRPMVSGVPPTVVAVFEASMPQIMNIAPMLMIVRVGLDRARDVGDPVAAHGRQTAPREMVSVRASTLENCEAGISSSVLDIDAAHDNEGKGDWLFTMNHTIDTNAFEQGWDFALSAMTGLTVFSSSCCQGMAASSLYHWTGSARKILAAAALAMGMLATAQAALQIREIVVQLQFVRAGVEGELRLHPNSNLNFASDAPFVTNNLVVDSLLTYRCLVVWGHNVRVIALPILLLLTTAALGYVPDVYGHISEYSMGVVMALLTHIVLVGLTGRIWWIRRDARVLESAHTKTYNTVIAIILESGAMYLIGNITWLIFSLLSPQDSPTLSSPGSFIVRLSIPQIMTRSRGFHHKTSTKGSGALSCKVAVTPVQPSRLNMPVVSSDVNYIGAVRDEAGMAPDLRKEGPSV